MITPRSAWSPKHGRGYETPGPQTRVVVHHDPLRELPANPTRAQIARQIQILEEWSAKKHTPTNPRLSYQFVAVDQTAEIWEGLGWGRIGAHVAGHNTASLGIIIIGIDGQRSVGRPETWAAIADLIREGIRLGHLAPADQLVIEPHRARVNTTCPGDVLAAYVERLSVPGMVAGGLPPMSEIPAPSGRLATELPAVPAVNLDRIILPTREHYEAAAQRMGYDPRSMGVMQWLEVARFIFDVMARTGVKQMVPAAAVLERVLAEVEE